MRQGTHDDTQPFERQIVIGCLTFNSDLGCLSDTAPVDVDFSAASAGVAAEASRQDHKHDVAEALVGDLVAVDGGAAAVGSAIKFVRADHKHALGPLQANLNYNQKQLTGQVMHVAASAPNVGTEVEGHGQSIKRFFVNEASIGFSAEIVGAWKRLPNRFGQRLNIALRTVAGYKCQLSGVLSRGQWGLSHTNPVSPGHSLLGFLK